MEKDIEIGGGIGHSSMSNDDDFMRVLVKYTHPEDSELMKDADNNMIDKIQGKSDEVEVNPDDDNDLDLVNLWIELTTKTQMHNI